MEAYLDNSATTRCSDRATKLMVKLLEEDYGNPSSLHQKGLDAENYIKDAKKKIAKTLKVTENEIFFTSGGTESNNLAIIGTAMANKRTGMHIITTEIEHASVSNPMKYLEEQGFSVTYLGVDDKGRIRLDELEEAVREDTILVSMMHVNNEIGTIEPVAEAAKIIHGKNPKTYIHVDAIQSYGKMPIYPKRIGIDLLSVSGHKIHGPKGSGFLFIKEKTKIKPVIFGGGQQNGMRSGTENVPAIAGLGEAAEEIYENSKEKIDRLYDLQKKFIEKVTAIEGVTVNGEAGRMPDAEAGSTGTAGRMPDTEADSTRTAGRMPDAGGHLAAPHIVSVTVTGVRSEVLLHSLEQEGVYVSSGSACSSNGKKTVSHTLKAIGMSDELADSTVRFSFSVYTTEEEILYAAECLERVALQRRTELAKDKH